MAAVAVLLALLLASALAAAFPSDLGYSPTDLENEASMRALFSTWMERHGMRFTDVEKETRFSIFAENVRYIHMRNGENTGTWLGVNKFAHLSNSEFRAKYLGYSRRVGSTFPNVSHSGFIYKDVKAPGAIDWRQKGAVTDVKNQQSCGSCWAFSTTGAIEGINQIVTGELVSVSEQELVDCDLGGSSDGCNGGLYEDAFSWVINNGGIATEDDYPYSAVQGDCDASQAAAVTIDDFAMVPANNEGALTQAVARQPVAVAIEAGGPDFQFYQRGIFNLRCGVALDHAVLAVGYGVERRVPFWIVKNSWGADWGEAGYFRLRRGMKDRRGQCGVAMEPCVPIKSASLKTVGRKVGAGESLISAV